MFLIKKTDKQIQQSTGKIVYFSLDGLRAYATIGIVLMHVLSNMATKPSANIVTEKIIPWFTNFTLLFMIVSAFSMCCGYYERVKKGTIDPVHFYAKRYHRIWPFFAMMVIIAFIIKPSWSTFYEAFADLTLCFNLLPNPKIEVIGVGWFLGTVFTFYMLFPFFTFLLDNKRKGWFVLALSLVFCYIAINYFGTSDFIVKPIDKVNIIYSAPFFIAGGMVYLYRDTLQTFVSKHCWLTLSVCVTLNVMLFVIQSNKLFVIPNLVIFTAWLIYAIGSKDKVLNNRIVKYLSGISMEIYLCHMMIFRVTSILHLDRLIENQNVLYIITFFITIIGAIIFSHIMKFWGFPLLEKKLKNVKNENIVSK